MYPRVMSMHLRTAVRPGRHAGLLLVPNYQGVLPTIPTSVLYDAVAQSFGHELLYGASSDCIFRLPAAQRRYADERFVVFLKRHEIHFDVKHMYDCEPRMGPFRRKRKKNTAKPPELANGHDRVYDLP